MAKFKVGDRVMVVQSEKTRFYCGFNSYMKRQANTIQDIMLVRERKNHMEYRLDKGSNWHEDDLALATEAEIAKRALEIEEEKRKEEEELREQEKKRSAFEIIGYAKT